MKPKKKKKSKEVTQTEIGLYLDPSGSHLAFAYVEIDHSTQSATIFESGMLWTKAKWSRGHRFQYMYSSLKYLIESCNKIPTYVQTEQFFFNPKLRSGTAVVPIINSYAEMICSRNNRAIYSEVPPPTWRATLGIKHILDSNGKRDYKTPTKDKVESIIGKLPNEIKSNITLKMRDLPTDIADVLAIAIAHLKKQGIHTIKRATSCFDINNTIEELNKIAESIE